MRGFENVPTDFAPATVWQDDDGNWQQTLEFIVAGVPISQGNMITGRYGNIYDKTKGLRVWRERVTYAARNAMHGRYRSGERSDAMLQQFSGAVALDVTFVLKRPVATPKTRPTPHAVKKPDLSKIVRAVEDSLTDAGVWHDDSQVVETHSRKRIADYGETPGVAILVTSNVMFEGFSK